MRVQLLILVFFVAVAAATEVPVFESDEVEWEKFKKKFDRHFEAGEEAERFAIFKANLKRFREHNEKFKRGESSHVEGITQFADLSNEEFPNRFTNDYFRRQMQHQHPDGSNRMININTQNVKGDRVEKLVAETLKAEPASSDADVPKLESDEAEWEKFKKKFNKQYDTRDEENHRFKIFKETLRAIRKQNEKFARHEVSYFQNINEFSDLTPQEFKNGNMLRPLFEEQEQTVDMLGTDEEEWQKFKRKFNKHYENNLVEAFRFGIFRTNLQQIRENNEKYARHEVSFQQGVNEFSDLTKIEFAKKYLMNNGQKNNLKLLEAVPVNNVITETDLTAVKNGLKNLLNSITGVVTPPPQVNNDDVLGSDDEEWKKFKAKFNKHYENFLVEAFRYGIFRSNLQQIRVHNEKYARREVPFKQGVNEFSDLTKPEFDNRYLMHNGQQNLKLLDPVPANNNIVPETDLNALGNSFKNLMKTFSGLVTPPPQTGNGNALGSDDQEWEAFKVKFNKHYRSPLEEAYRKVVFLNTLKGIRENNEKYARHEVSWREGINEFADETREESKNKLNGINVRLPLYKDDRLDDLNRIRIGTLESPVVPLDAKVVPKFESDEVEWEKFKINYNKHYDTPTEEAARFGVFQARLRSIKEHNQKYLRHEVSDYQAINQFADLTPEEVKNKYTGLSLPQDLLTKLRIGALKPPLYTVPQLESDEVEWEKFKTKFNKHYSTPAEEDQRFKIFQGHLNGIREHNQKYLRHEVSDYQGYNQFADLTPEEVKSSYNGLRLPQQDLLNKLRIGVVNPPIYTVPQLESDEVEWEKFKTKFNKHYSTPAEEAQRFSIFQGHLNGIREHNQKYLRHEVSDYQGYNQFADLTPEEVKSSYNGLRLPQQDLLNKLRIGVVNPPIYTVPQLESDEVEWEKFKTKFNKHYSTPAEEAQRFSIFQGHLNGIRQHNQKYLRHEVSDYQGINQFSDLTPEEVKNNYTGLSLPQDLLTKLRIGVVKPPLYTVPQLESDEVEWEKFKTKFNKHYSTPAEEAQRFQIFQGHLNGIREHNQKYLRHEVSYYQGYNQFADLTPEEVKSQHTGLKLPQDDVLDDIRIGVVKPPLYNVPQLESDEVEWEKFKTKFNKHYSTPSEEAQRFNIFQGHLNDIRQHNQKYLRHEVSDYQGVNQFSDLTPEEVKNKYTGLSLPQDLLTKLRIGVVKPPLYTVPQLESDEVEWEKFKTKFNKHYSTPAEEAQRFSIFQGHLNGIRQHNQKYLRHEVSDYQGINQFSDLTPEEVKNNYTGLSPPQDLLNKLRIGVVKPPLYTVPQLESDEVEWEKFKTKFNKHYSTPAEEAQRFKIFQGHLNGIREHNQKYLRHEVSYYQGYNQFADLTPEEVKSQHTGLRLPQDDVLDDIRIGVVKPPLYNVPQLESDEVEWEKFKTKFNKHYSTPAEEAQRFSIFQGHLNGIREHNQKYLRHEVSDYQGINQFSDLTPEEVKNNYTGLRLPQVNVPKLESDEVQDSHLVNEVGRLPVDQVNVPKLQSDEVEESHLVNEVGRKPVDQVNVPKLESDEVQESHLVNEVGRLPVDQVNVPKLESDEVQQSHLANRMGEPPVDQVNVPKLESDEVQESHLVNEVGRKPVDQVNVPKLESDEVEESHLVNEVERKPVDQVNVPKLESEEVQESHLVNEVGRPPVDQVNVPKLESDEVQESHLVNEVGRKPVDQVNGPKMESDEVQESHLVNEVGRPPVDQVNVPKIESDEVQDSHLVNEVGRQPVDQVNVPKLESDEVQESHLVNEMGRQPVDQVNVPKLESDEVQESHLVNEVGRKPVDQVNVPKLESDEVQESHLVNEMGRQPVDQVNVPKLESDEVQESHLVNEVGRKPVDQVNVPKLESDEVQESHLVNEMGRQPVDQVNVPKLESDEVQESHLVNEVGRKPVDQVNVPKLESNEVEESHLVNEVERKPVDQVNVPKLESEEVQESHLVNEVGRLPVDQVNVPKLESDEVQESHLANRMGEPPVDQVNVPKSESDEVQESHLVNEVGRKPVDQVNGPKMESDEVQESHLVNEVGRPPADQVSVPKIESDEVQESHLVNEVGRLPVDQVNVPQLESDEVQESHLVTEAGRPPVDQVNVPKLESDEVQESHVANRVGRPPVDQVNAPKLESDEVQESHLANRVGRPPVRLVNVPKLESDDIEWEKFKVKFNKHYATPAEASHRFRIFKQNLRRIRVNHERYARGQVSYLLGVNVATDYAPNENAFVLLNNGNDNHPSGSILTNRRKTFTKG